MPILLRAALILVSVLTTFWILRKIRKSQVQIADSVFWLAFSFILTILSLFPSLAELGAKLIGISSPTNFLYLSIIFILLIKLFLLSIKVSQQEHRLQAFAQTYAINEAKRDKEDMANKKMENNTKNGTGGGVTNSPLFFPLRFNMFLLCGVGLK